MIKDQFKYERRQVLLHESVFGPLEPPSDLLVNPSHHLEYSRTEIAQCLESQPRPCFVSDHHLVFLTRPALSPSAVFHCLFA